ncbi:MAG: enoyl-CoA hydratase/isomerase family protein [Candidatus Rokubacteria bacterium]|nr:enoyl-CoA hydratase/isomerase family protein [Candidatus Rokubacteria bacterium]
MSAVLEQQVDSVRVLTLNRPEALNALTAEAMSELGARLEAAAADPAVRAVVVTGAGEAFSAGGDRRFLLEIPSMEPGRVREIVYASFQRPTRAMRAMEKPVIAAVNGAPWARGASSRSPRTSAWPRSEPASARCGSSSDACPPSGACSSCPGSWVSARPRR